MTVPEVIILGLFLVLAAYVWWSHRNTARLMDDLTATLNGVEAVQEREADRLDVAAAQAERLVAELYPLGFPGDQPARRRFDA